MVNFVPSPFENFTPMSQKHATDLSKFDNSNFNPGGAVKRLLWFFCNAFFLQNKYNPFSGLKVLVLRLFGAKIGNGVVVKPNVNVKYPWKLTVGNHVWIGERVWIDNLDEVIIEDHCCISQGAMLLCGNHNYSKVSFDLITKPIHLEQGVWIGAFSIVTPGVKCHSHAVLAVKSVATKNLEKYSIYQGNPAVKIRERKITQP